MTNWITIKLAVCDLFYIKVSNDDISFPQTGSVTYPPKGPTMALPPLHITSEADFKSLYQAKSTGYISFVTY